MIPGLIKSGNFIIVPERVPVKSPVHIQTFLDGIRHYLITHHKDLLRCSLFSPNHRHQLEEVIKEYADRHLPADYHTVDAKEVVWEICGLGPIEPYAVDYSISEITIYDYNEIWIRRGQHEIRTGSRFDSKEHLYEFIMKITRIADKNCPLRSPRTSFELPGAFLSIVRSNTSTGIAVAIRKSALVPVSLEDYHETRALSLQAIDFLSRTMNAGLNTVISGTNRSEQITLLRCLIGRVPAKERILVIEKSPELWLEAFYPEKDIVHILSNRLLFPQPVINAHRIVLPHITDDNIWMAIDVLLLGYTGLFTAIGNNISDTLERLILMYVRTLQNPSKESIENAGTRVTKAIDLIIHMNHDRVMEIAEVLGYSYGKVVVNPIFRYEEGLKMVSLPSKELCKRIGWMVYPNHGWVYQKKDTMNSIKFNAVI